MKKAMHTGTDFDTITSAWNHFPLYQNRSLILKVSIPFFIISGG